MIITHEGTNLNPAISFGYALFSGEAIFGYPQYYLLPFGGAVIGLIFYELVFVRTLDYLNIDDDDEGEELGNTM